MSLLWQSVSSVYGYDGFQRRCEHRLRMTGFCKLILFSFEKIARLLHGGVQQPCGGAQEWAPVGTFDQKETTTMEQTANLKLPQWAADDPILHTDFNAAFAAIDVGCGNCRIAVGSYTGDGQHGAAHPNSIILPFAPQLVFFTGEAEPHNNIPVYHILLRPQQTMNLMLNYEGSVTWREDGVSWYNDEEGYQLNNSGVTYHYIALG